MNNYWTATDDILKSTGAPNCPACGETMYPQDDHGRFACSCRMQKATQTPKKESDAQKPKED